MSERAARLTRATPFVPCSRPVPQIAFYSGVLGFAVRFEAEDCGYLSRDGAAIRLLKVEPDATPPYGSIYIDVDGLDAVYEDLAPALAHLGPGRVRPPFEQPYGQREIHVADEDRTIVFFGEAVSSPRA